MNRFQVRVCPISARERAIDFLISSEVLTPHTTLVALAARRAAMARVMSVCVTGQPEGGAPTITPCVPATIALPNCIASEVAAGVPDMIGRGFRVRLAPTSFLRVAANIAARTGAFCV